MKIITAVALAGTLLASPVLALADTAVDPAVLAPIKQLTEGFNANAPAKIAGAHVASPIILDEFAPYSWSGPSAILGWGGDFAKFAASKGVISGAVQINDPSLAEVNGDHAYVVAPSVITFKTAGRSSPGPMPAGPPCPRTPLRSGGSGGTGGP